MCAAESGGCTGAVGTYRRIVSRRVESGAGVKSDGNECRSDGNGVQRIKYRKSRNRDRGEKSVRMIAAASARAGEGGRARNRAAIGSSSADEEETGSALCFSKMREGRRDAEKRTARQTISAVRTAVAVCGRKN
jgi:hypothetical protein